MLTAAEGERRGEEQKTGKLAPLEVVFGNIQQQSASSAEWYSSSRSIVVQACFLPGPTVF